MEVRLSDYATAPLYNIKAVVQATGVSPSTLRAWERRYNFCRPQRSENGYRLYTERDIALIRWLKTQVGSGMSISQAVTWLEALGAQAGGMAHVALPDSATASGSDGMPQTTQRDHVRDVTLLQDDLLAALIDYNEDEAEQVMAEAFALYPVEQVGERLIRPVLVEIGERWGQGKLSVATEHFATGYVQQRLAALLRAIPNRGGPLVWIGCAPSELHDIGALLLGIYLRRAGYRVHYLGQSLACDQLGTEVQRRRPALILLSASTQTAAEMLAELAQCLASSGPPCPLIGYGGRIFVQRPELRAAIAGIYLGDDAHAAVRQVDELLLDRSRVAPLFNP